VELKGMGKARRQIAEIANPGPEDHWILAAQARETAGAKFSALGLCAKRVSVGGDDRF